MVGPIPYPVPPAVLNRPSGDPLGYGVFGAIFHLEPLTPAEEASLAAVNDLVMSWIGTAFSYTYSTLRGSIDPFRPADLDMIAGYPLTLSPPTDPQLDAESDALAHVLMSHASDEVAVFAHGGSTPMAASPYTYRFYSEIPEPGAQPAYQALSMLRVTVPTTCPLEAFRAAVTAIAAKLPLSWGAAGLMLSGEDLVPGGPYRARVFAHARRFTGYDVDLCATRMATWYTWVRTVSWMTFLGPAMQARLAAAERSPTPTSLVDVATCGPHMVLTAGAAPEPGDLNRRQLPPAYVDADRMIRPVRAATGVDFYEPWDENSTEAWLRRFERRFS